MFDLVKSSVFFEQMSSAHPTLVQNIEVVYENKIQLDATYHRPKHFILNLNNLLRSLLFFMENSVKNSPDWLKEAVIEYRDSNRDEYEQLKYLRNVSAHQKLVFPDESLVGGLFRIRSEKEYVLKLGFGDFEKPGKYSWDLAKQNTQDIFHDMLVFSSIAFMDIEHSALGECLGITRKWFFKINFKSKTKRYNDIVDVYQLASSFSTKLLDHVCSEYALHKNIKTDRTFSLTLKENNFINTLLEIDIYPSLFSEWWGETCEPLNFGVRSEIFEGERHHANNEFYQWIHNNLCEDEESYKSSLMRFLSLEPDEIFKEEVFGEFLSFISVNHWHFKNAFDYDLMDSPVSPADIMMLQRSGNIFIDEYRKKKLCTIDSTKKQLNKQITKLLTAIESGKNAQ